MTKIELPEFAPESLAFRTNPYPVYRVYQKYAPVYYREEYNDWFITGYSFVKKIIENNSHRGESEMPIKRVDLEWKDVLQVEPVEKKFLTVKAKLEDLNNEFFVDISPPYHTHVRKAVKDPFSLGNIKLLYSYIAELANELLDKQIAKEEIEVVNDYAFPLTVTVICKLLDIPVNDKNNLRKWVEDLMVNADLYLHKDKIKGKLAFLGLTNYLHNILLNRVENPGNDFLSYLIKAKIEGKISSDSFLSISINIILAGFINSQNGIVMAIYYLLKFPEQLNKLRENPELIKSAVEELLRFSSPVHTLSYYCTDSFTIDNHTIHKGQGINLILGAANRDSEQFSNPDELHIIRKHNPHLAFSSGTHFCLGAALARLEMEIAISIIIKKLPNLKLIDSSPEWSDIYFLRGLKSLKVAF